MAELYVSKSPYHFSGNNPIRYLDDNGMNYDVYYNGSYSHTVETSDGEKSKHQKEEEERNKPNLPSNISELINYYGEKIWNYFGWGLDPENADDRKKMEQGAKNVENATNTVNAINKACKFIIINGALFILTDGGSVIVSEYVNGTLLSRAAAPEVANVVKAFFSGEGAGAKALAEGYETISQTRAAQNLAKLTEGMAWQEPVSGQAASEAWQMWSRLSAAWAKSIPEGSTVNVYLNNASATGIWNLIEKPILESRNVKIIVNTVTAAPK